MNERLMRYMNSPRISEPRYWESHIDLPQLKYARNVLRVGKETQKKELAQLAVDMRADQMQFMRVVKEYVKRHELDKEARRQAQSLRELTHERPVFGSRFGRF